MEYSGVGRGGGVMGPGKLHLKLCLVPWLRVWCVGFLGFNGKPYPIKLSWFRVVTAQAIEWFHFKEFRVEGPGLSAA